MRNAPPSSPRQLSKMIFSHTRTGLAETVGMLTVANATDDCSPICAMFTPTSVTGRVSVSPPLPDARRIPPSPRRTMRPPEASEGDCSAADNVL